ncbi:hypothetical protein [Raoultella terrigena]|uniref:hypothetical protein n=1 Tax=Raoultella terrigena TaxID=577 RepID=UPI001D0D5BB0|nr:hypothetical protein [Raoultella terrigena]
MSMFSILQLPAGLKQNQIAAGPAIFNFVLITPRGCEWILLLSPGGKFPYAEERSVHLSMQFVIRTRISLGWLIHREAPDAATRYTGIP